MKQLTKLLGLAAALAIICAALPLTGCPTGGGGGGTTSTTGGGNWKTVDVSSIFGTNSILGIAYGNGTFVAVGNNDGKIAYSSDGVTWTAVNTGYNYIMNRVAYGSNKFVTGTYHGSGGPRVAYSTDGKTGWAILSSALEAWSDNQIYGLGYGNGTFIAAWGDDGKISTSTNGTSWTNTTVTALSGGEIYGIAYGGPAGQEKFVAVGNYGKAAYSTNNGTSWTTVDTKLDKTTQGQINCVVWGKDKFVAGDRHGKIAYSPDGINWTAISNSIVIGIYAIAYGNGTFVAGGSNGQMATSTDGVTWTAVKTSIFGTSETIEAIAFGNGTFVAGSSSGKMAYSTGN